MRWYWSSLLVCACLLAVVRVGQAETSTPRIGFAAGPGIASMSAAGGGIDSRSGFSFRLHYDRPIGENVFIRTSGSYFPGGASLPMEGWSPEIRLSYVESGLALGLLIGDR